MDELTARQREVLELMAKDLNTDDIAERIGTTRRNAEYILVRICKNLGVRSRVGAAIIFVTENMQNTVRNVERVS